MNQQLLDFIAACPTAFHAVQTVETELEKHGFTRLNENDGVTLTPGGRYYLTRNRSSLIAFRLPKAEPSGFLIAAAHSDSPCFKLKDNALMADEHYARLDTEKYGGMILSTWMDRPLAIAGRVVLRDGDKITTRLVDTKKTVALIPNVPIHFNRNINDGVALNPAVDMVPLYAGTPLADLLGYPAEDLLAADLFTYNPQKGEEWGEYVSSPRLDDLQCAFAALQAFLQAENASAVPVYCLLDNEEVGSGTKQGADSTFLSDTLSRIGGSRTAAMLVASFMASCDNAHAVPSNHPELTDKNNAVYMNHGVVIKFNANQKYSSDAVSAGLFRVLCQRAGVPTQAFANRSDIAGGSTLGNIANTHVALNTVDIGCAQMAMHSAYETTGARDTEDMVKALTALFTATLRTEKDGEYTL